MNELLNVSASPHVRNKLNTSMIMFMVIVALLPATGFGIYNFGLHALMLIVVTIASTVLTEFIYEKCMKKKVSFRLQ